MNDENKNIRAEPRRKLVINLSGHLVQSLGRQPIRCMAVDICRSGIGLVSFDELSVGSEVILLLREKGIVLKVRWCKPDSVRKGVYHIGLGTDDLSINLVKVLKDDGLLKDAVGDSTEKSKDVASGPITFSTLGSLLATAGTTDPSVFHRGGLGSLANSYNAYPLNYEGTSYFVLLPKGLKPADAVTLDDDQAAEKKIFVVFSGRGGFGSFNVIWPKKALKES